MLVAAATSVGRLGHLATTRDDTRRRLGVGSGTRASSATIGVLKAVLDKLGLCSTCLDCVRFHDGVSQQSCHAHLTKILLTVSMDVRVRPLDSGLEEGRHG